MCHWNGSFPLCRPTELFPLWPFGDTLHQLHVHIMRITTSNRAWVLTITEMLRREECVALCFGDYNKIAAFKQHHISTTRSEGRLLKYTKNSVSWRWLKYICTENVLYIYPQCKNTQHYASCLMSCDVPIHLNWGFLYFILFFFKVAIFFTDLFSGSFRVSYIFKV